MTPQGRTAKSTGRILAAIMSLGIPLTMAAPAMASTARPWDFNGDGRRDLAIGVAGENANAGAVVVLRGTSDGVSTENARIFSQDSAGVPGVAEAGDRFGATLASGDFDADGYADLAIAAPGEDSSTDIDVGSVVILYGGSGGLRASGAHALDRPDAVLGDPDPEEAELGFRMIAGNFDDDADHDLVVGVTSGPGGLLVYRGRSSGLATLPAQSVGPGHGLPNFAEAFPGPLATGDLDGNGVTDLAVGWMEADGARGAVAVLYGADGIGIDLDGDEAPGPQVWTQDSAGVKGVAEPLDAFGSAVGIGDVTGDGRKDLVVSALQQPTSDEEATGALHVLKGSSGGVTATGDQYVRYDALVADPVGALGVELAVGDLDADGIADVAVTHGVTDSHRWGAVLVLYGDRDGLGSDETSNFTQASWGINGIRSNVDYWGEELRIRDVGKSATADLIVADPYEPISSGMAGMVNILWGSSSGVSGSRSPFLTQDTAGVPGVAEDGDRFGSAL